MRKDIIIGVIGIVILCYFGQSLNALYPKHARHEYAMDIASYKAKYPKKYFFFPDKIPKTASGVEWICLPSMLQGSGYRKLFFYADESYIHELRELYIDEATIYTYDHYAWINQDLEKDESTDTEDSSAQTKHTKSITLPDGNSMKEEERNDIEAFVMYEVQDSDHNSNSGFYINEKEHYVCFWAQ